MLEFNSFVLCDEKPNKNKLEAYIDNYVFFINIGIFENYYLQIMQFVYVIVYKNEKILDSEIQVSFLEILKNGTDYYINKCKYILYNFYLEHKKSRPKPHIAMQKLSMHELQSMPFTKKTYRELCNKYHPDKNKLDIEISTENMKMINGFFKNL